jgi:transposase
LKIEIISFCSNEVRLVVKTRLLKATCPSCGWQSDKAHSRYQRHLADLPWEGVAVKLILSARKFFCLNPDCRRRIFCERLPGLDVPVATDKNDLEPCPSPKPHPTLVLITWENWI